MRSAKIVLDGTEYEVPAFNLGQLEKVAPLLIANQPFAVLRVALERATPKPDIDTLAPTLDEVGNAVRAMLAASGLQQPDANPPGNQAAT